MGIDTVCIVRNEYENVSTIIKNASSIVSCDLNRILELDKKIPCGEYDALIHLGWTGSSGKLRADYGVQINNTKICVDSAVAAKKVGCKKFVGVGSITEKMYVPYLQKNESHSEPTMCYAVAKMAGQLMSKCICEKEGLEFNWGYISNFYGEGDKSLNIVNFLITNYLNNQIPELTDGMQMADFTYVSDVADGLIHMAADGQSGHSYYIGYGRPAYLKSFVEEIWKRINPAVQTGLGKKLFHGIDIDYALVDMKKLERDTGFSSQVSFSEGIDRTIRWIKQKNE